MVLILPSTPEPQADLLEAVLGDAELQQSTQQFLSHTQSAPWPVDLSICRLYVHQGEQAFTTWGTPPWTDLVLGSQSATTCLIMVVRCPLSRRAYAVHHDRGSVEFGAGVLLAFLQGMTQPEVYLVGSFHEDSGESHHIASTLLHHLHCDTKQRIYMRLACLWTANTNPMNQHFLAHSLYVQCSTGRAFPAILHDEEIPDLPRRFAFPSCCSISDIQCDLVTVSLYDHPGHVLLPPVPVPRHAMYIDYLMHKLTQPDEWVLRKCSTSPEHEPEYFVRQLQKSWVWTVKAYQQMLEQQHRETQPAREVPMTCYVWTQAGSAGDVDVDGGHVGWTACDVPEGITQEHLTVSDCVTVAATVMATG